MFSSLTPEANSDLRTPAMRAEMISVFHLAWTIAIRRLEPEWKAKCQMVDVQREGMREIQRLAIVNLSLTRPFQRCHNVHKRTLGI